MIKMEQLVVDPSNKGISHARIFQEATFFKCGEFYVYNVTEEEKIIRLESKVKKEDLPDRIILDINGKLCEEYSDLRCLGLSDNKGCNDVPVFYIYEWIKKQPILPNCKYC